jgi:hypothetical protein
VALIRVVWWGKKLLRRTYKAIILKNVDCKDRKTDKWLQEE